MGRRSLQGVQLLDPGGGRARLCQMGTWVPSSAYQPACFGETVGISLLLRPSVPACVYIPDTGASLLWLTLPKTTGPMRLLSGV